MGYISVIGAGSWGTTLARLVAEQGYDTILWAHEREVVDEINNKGTNKLFLPGVTLSSKLKASLDIEETLSRARYIVNAVPTQFIRSVFTDAAKYVSSDSLVVSASKGIEHGTLLTASRILKEILHCRVSVLSGPSFAHEVANRLPTAVTLAAEHEPDALILQEIFNTSYFRVYTHYDMLGVELGGALKNVIAIASGISDGLGLGHDARAALITRGLAEISRLGAAMGADGKTFSGLSGMGDLVLTCTGALSRNYSVGISLGQGKKLDDILSGTKSVAEGVATAKSAYDLGLKYNVEMPIVEQVFNVLYQGKDPAIAVSILMSRALKSEFSA